jgi:hypothetical protein
LPFMRQSILGEFHVPVSAQDLACSRRVAHAIDCWVASVC